MDKTISRDYIIVNHMRKYGQSEVEKWARIQFSCEVLLNLSGFPPAAIIITASVKHPCLTSLSEQFTVTLRCRERFTPVLTTYTA